MRNSLSSAFNARNRPNMGTHLLGGRFVEQHDYSNLVRRDDKQVTYAFAAKQGRRGNMEDFTFAQVRHDSV